MSPSRFAARSFILASLVSCLPAIASAQYRATTFFVVAHQDDWQLFMQPNAYYDAQNRDVKVVFIYLTAGNWDKGAGVLQKDGVSFYYQARETGAVRAARFVSTRPEESNYPGKWQTVTVNGHSMARYVYNNTFSYFLRLPDGGKYGDGFAPNNNQSLEKFYKGDINSISDILGTTTYYGWNDLVSTLRQILVKEARYTPRVFVNVQDPDTDVNTSDHSDHTHTGLAMIEAASAYSCVNQARFLDYVTREKPENLEGADRLHEFATWGATVSGLVDSGFTNNYDDAHNSWLGRNYFTVQNGTGSCFFW